METILNKESRAAIELMIADGIIAKDAAERYFPELKESEDERVRKDIIVLVKDWWDRVNKDNISTKEQMIAWLEKQGKNDMGISKATKKELEDNLNKALEKETPESWNEFLEKQGEQKPAWSEEDERTYKSITYSFAHNYSLTVQQQEFVKSLKDRFTWKPSEKQMEALDRAQAELCSTEYNKPICDLIDSLNKLRGE